MRVCFNSHAICTFFHILSFFSERKTSSFHIGSIDFTFITISGCFQRPVFIRFSIFILCACVFILIWSSVCAVIKLMRGQFWNVKQKVITILFVSYNAHAVALQLIIRLIYKLLMAYHSENKRENENKTKKMSDTK